MRPVTGKHCFKSDGYEWERIMLGQGAFSSVRPPDLKIAFTSYS